MTRLTLQDPALRLKAEYGILAPILAADSLAGSRLIGTLLETLRLPLSQWFSAPANRAIAVALDAHLRGETDCDQTGVTTYLAGMPHEALHLTLTGKKVSTWKACDFEGSALASVGGYAGAFPPEGFYPASQALGSANLLRWMVEKERTIALLRATALEVQNANITQGTEDMLTGCIELVSAITTTGKAARTMGQGMRDAVTKAKHDAQRRANGESAACSWGIPELDELCPMRPGALIILSAPPGAGKTSLALMAASATAAVGGRDSVAISSMEMRLEELAIILGSRELGMSAKAIKDWTPEAQAREPEILSMIDSWEKHNGIAVRESVGGERQTVSAIISWFRRRKAAAKGKLALGILDYIGLLEGEGKQTEYDKLSIASAQLKQAAQSLEIPILCLSQLNREGRKGIRDSKTGETVAQPEPRKEDLNGSGSLEANADAIVFVHFPKVTSGLGNPRGQIIVAKQRGGPTGKIDVIFHGAHQVFSFCPPIQNKSMSQEPNESEDHYT